MVLHSDSALLAAMEGQPVLVAGDIMLDRFVTGAAQRLSPEAPVPVLKRGTETTALGGAGGVVANLAALGARPHVVAVAGDDMAGRTLETLLRAAGADIAGLVIDRARPTTQKTRFMSGPHHLLRLDDEEAGAVTAETAAQLLAAARTVMPSMKAVVLSDYGKGVLGEAVIRELMRMARTHGIPVLVDPKGHDYRRYDGATLVTPNRAELAQAAGRASVKTDEDIVSAAQAVMAQATIGAVVATRSEDGISVVRADGRPATHIPTRKIPVFEVSGAGDVVIATIAAALAGGVTLEDAARLANRAGGIAVGKPGTAPVTRAELLAGAVSSATPRARAQQTIAAWQADGQRVGFTNGCFDILHVGHVTYLQQARSLCDRLVVGLNADESVRRLKGPTRPVNDEGARATVLAALSCVDMVVLFGDAAADEDMPCALLDFLRPAVIFKGGDYTEDQLPEARVVRAYGGDVRIMGLVEGHSTTATIARMKA